MLSNLILGGDFNCGSIDWSSNVLHSDVASSACDVVLLEVAEKYGLNQHVNSPTRPASRRTLDLVFSTNRNFIQACHVVPGINDHDAILFEIDVRPKFTVKPPRKVLQHHKGDYDGIRSNMASFANSYLTSSPENRTVDENWTIISDAIKSAVHRFIPSKTAKGKRHLPWISPAIKRLMNRRDRAYNKARRTGKTQHLSAYKRLRNNTTKRIRETHSRYLDEVMRGIDPNPN